MIDKNIGTNEETFSKIESIFKEYNKTMRQLKKELKMIKTPELYKDYLLEVFEGYTLSDIKGFVVNWDWYYQEFKKRCLEACPNLQELANCCVRLCYEKYPSNNKKFMWKMAGEGIIINLKQKTLRLPLQCSKDEAEFTYLGKYYKMKEVLELDK